MGPLHDFAPGDKLTLCTQQGTFRAKYLRRLPDFPDVPGAVELYVYTDTGGGYPCLFLDEDQIHGLVTLNPALETENR